jgi:ATP-dependent DNA helicase RecQ
MALVLDDKVTEQKIIQEDMESLLKSVFGYSQFRENQEKVIHAVMAGQDVFTSMPTGGGKSLCYQLPGLMLEGLTVVISPLIALMKDQVDEAIARGISAAYLNSTLNREQAAQTMARLYAQEIKLLYLSPERLAAGDYIQKLREWGVAFFAIDEAHCLSEWGHDFRPDYLLLSELRKFFPDIPLSAFTATATLEVQKDIIRILGLRDPLLIRASFDRQELHYAVKPKSRVLDQITQAIKDRPDAPGIVYRLSRKDVEKTAGHLQAMGISALPYHAGMTKEERSKNQEFFNQDRVDVIVATTAFGMGINKNNIRYVIHGDLPKSMEGYYQETGRAGRDGLDSDCILFYTPGDIAKQNYFIDQIEDERERQRSRDNLNTLVRFATVNVCRRQQILEYFGESHCGECGTCDVCNDTSEKVDATVDAQKILSAVARTREGFGAGHIIDIVWGADTEKIRSRGHQDLPTFGVGKDKSKKWWRNIVNELLGQQALTQDRERYNVLCFTEKGKRILYQSEPFTISDISAAAREIGQPSLASRAGQEKDQDLFALLKAKRKGLAQEKGVPPYIIFSDKALSDMSLIKPTNDQEFLLVSGVGAKKLKDYGPEFLPVVREYLDEKAQN